MRAGRGTTARVVTALAGGALVLAACGSGDDAIESTDTTSSTSTTSTTSATTSSTTTTVETVPPTTVAATTSPPSTTPAPTAAASTTAAPTTTAVPTTAAPTPTTVAPTTATPTTTVAAIARDAQQVSMPVAPPADTHADEPVIPMGTLSIPSIDVSMEMYSGIRMSTLDRGPGHWPGTALPGQVGNVVVGGHRTSNHRVFRDVDQLAAGDEIIFDDDAGRHVYAVREVRVVEPTDVWIIDPTETATATLFACHPPGSVAQRIVVFADLVA